MINTYEKYLEHQAGNILKIEDALKIYTKLTACIEQCKLEDKMEFWEEFLSKAADYSKIRNS